VFGPVLRFALIMGTARPSSRKVRMQKLRGSAQMHGFSAVCTTRTDTSVGDVLENNH